MRAFHHGAILYNTRSGVKTPKDLEGKRVGVNRGYTVTTGLWARSILQHEYGVDLTKVTWVLSGDEHVKEYQPPSNVVPIEAGRTLEDSLISGDVVAAIGAPVDSPDIRALIPNAEEAGLRAMRERGLYPINHTVVVKDEVLDAHPGVARDLFEAFTKAKRLYVQALLTGGGEAASPADRTFRRVAEIIADPLPYGLQPNRHVLEAIIQYSLEQKIISRAVEVDELFAAGTHELVG